MNSIPLQGYLARTLPHGGKHDHSLCGPNNVPGATSPNTGQPLLLQLTLDLSDPRLQLSISLSELHLFYSWTCGIHEGLFFYKEEASGVTIVRCAQGQGDSDFPYLAYPVYFPQEKVELESIDTADQRLIDEINSGGEKGFEVGLSRPDLESPQHQVGGRPRLVQPALDMFCPLCKRQMPILASIADPATDGQQFTGNAYVQVIYHVCEVCVVIGAYNICD